MFQIKAFQIRFYSSLLLCGLLLIPATVIGKTTLNRTEILSDNIDFEITVYPATGNDAILWLAPGYGFRNGQYELAELIAKQGTEVWMVDLTEMLFLPHGSQSMRKLTGKYVAELIERIYQRTGKKILLMSSFSGAVPVLRGARQWQLSKPKTAYLTGAVLFSPVMYAKAPVLGQNPVYLPDVMVNNIPVMIFQGEKSGNRWQLSYLLEQLYRQGAPVYGQMMHGITSLFYRDKRNTVTDHYFRSLPLRINQAIKLLKHTSTSTHALKKINTIIEHSSLDSELMPFRGNTHPHTIKLYNIKGKRIEISDFKHKVTLVNFWATWCPPCVKEIPSLNRLKKQMQGKPFEIISINYAESSAQINSFLKKFNVKFPILLDPDGITSKQWKVFVFPSTFVIGRDGKIQYGINAAIEWDDQGTIKKLESLMLP